MKSIAIIISHVVNDAVTHGFVPAAKALNMHTVLITDHKLDHLNLAINDKSFHPDQIIECDVFNPLDIIDTIIKNGFSPNIIFSNSDHLQTSTAIAAQFFKLPAKSWEVCLKAKNKQLTRETLDEKDLPNIKSWLIQSDQNLPVSLLFPLVAKPREGVASMDVQLCNNEKELNKYCQRFWQKQPNTPILLEEYIQGPLITLETLSDGQTIIPIGGFDVQLSKPPYFIETSASWNGPLSEKHQDACLQQLTEFGIGLGVCHSEFILTKTGPVLVEINYRSIGDGREFLLNNLAPYSWFETILQLHQGWKIDKPLAISGSAEVHYIIAEHSGIITGNTKSNKFQLDGIITQCQVLCRAGKTLTISHSNKDYLARISVASPTGKPLQLPLQQAINACDLVSEQEVLA